MATDVVSHETAEMGSVDDNTTDRSTVGIQAVLASEKKMKRREAITTGIPTAAETPGIGSTDSNADKSTVGIQAGLASIFKENIKQDEEEAEEDSSKTDADSVDEEQGVALLMVAEIQEKLGTAMQYYNQHHRFDTKVVAKFVYQFYRLVTCLGWLILPTIASLITSYIIDILFVDTKDLKMYKNYGLISANCVLWIYGFYNLISIWMDMKQCCNDLIQCLSDSRWMHEDEFVNCLLSHGMPVLPKTEVVGDEADTDRVETIEDEKEKEVEKNEKADIEIEAGAAGDVPNAVPKDKDV